MEGGTVEQLLGIDSKEAITVEAAEAIATMFSCNRVICETVGSMPCHLYQRIGDGKKQRADKHPLYRIIRRRPNSHQTPIEFFEYMQRSLGLRGNAYAKIVRRGNAQVESLEPLHPDSVKVLVSDDGLNSVSYEYMNPKRQKVVYDSSEILHLKICSDDGFRGRSIIDISSQVFRTANATETYTEKLFTNTARPSGILKMSQAGLKKDQIDRLKKDWNDAYSGQNNIGKTVILEAGMDWQALGLTNEQLQLIEQQKFSSTEICRLWRMPPHLVGDLEKATFSNIEQQALEFMTFTMVPWMVRWEQALMKLLKESEEETFYFEFQPANFLRGDLQSRYNAYNVGRNGGWLSVNEIRDLENMNAIEVSDDPGNQYLMPLNMGIMGKENIAEQGNEADAKAETQTKSSDSETKQGAD
jgi:HK97 family phage portal protein